MRVSGNKMSCFYIQNLVSQRKHLNSTKHMKKMNKHMKKNHIGIERNKSVAMVRVAVPFWMCYVSFLRLFSTLFKCRQSMFQQG